MTTRSALVGFCVAVGVSSCTVYAGPTLTTLVNFNGTNGFDCSAALIGDAFGNLYGTTSEGGPKYGGDSNGYGTIFEVVHGTNTLATIVSFSGDLGTGTLPRAGLIADNLGNLYGTTSAGGPSNDGTVFKIAANTNVLTTMVAFNGSTGTSPAAPLIFDAYGNLYGTTQFGGANGSGSGSVFMISAGTGMLTTLASLTGANGFNVYSSLVFDDSRNLYGTAFGTGINPNEGATVFKVAAVSNAVSTVVQFNGTNGSQPGTGLIIDNKGNLYGTGGSGGPTDDGTVFKIAAATGVISTLATFDGLDGASPRGKLIADAVGDLFGTTVSGGSNDDGTVFEVSAGTDILTTLATFTGINGEDPLAGLYADAAGNLYGTTSSGGANNDGTVFELTSTGFVVPEPSSVALAAVTSIALLCRRRSRA